jgi:hypothetical protein
VAIALLAVTASACEVGNPAYESGAMNCQMRPDSPHISSGQLRKTGVRHIDGKVEYECRLAVQSHHLSVDLKHEVSGGYVVMASGSDDRLPRPGGKPSTFTVIYPHCLSGRWRTTAQATALFQGQLHTSAVAHSPVRAIRC